MLIDDFQHFQNRVSIGSSEDFFCAHFDETEKPLEQTTLEV